MADMVENMISTKGIVPWHEKGVVVPQALVTSEEIIRAIGFDFKVVTRNNSTFVKANGQMQSIQLSDSFSTIRQNADGTESVLCGRVGRKYVPIQNVEAFGFFDHVVGAGEAIYETAGILKEGRNVFILAVLPDYIKVLGSDADTIKKYVLLSNWHDGTNALSVMFTDVRVVCNNTLNMALQSAESQVSIRHTASSEERLKEASRVMGMVNQYNVELGKAFDRLALAKITGDDLVKYVQMLMPVADDATDVQKANMATKQDAVLQLVEAGHGAQLETTRGTLWGAYNAVAEFVDHGGVKFRSSDNRAVGLLYGSGRQFKQRAFDTALELAGDKQLIQVAV